MRCDCWVPLFKVIEEISDIKPKRIQKNGVPVYRFWDVLNLWVEEVYSKQLQASGDCATDHALALKLKGHQRLLIRSDVYVK